MNSTKFNKNALSIGLLVFRLFIGFAMLTHGYEKLHTLIDGKNIQFMSFLGLRPEVSLALAVFAEFVCSIFIILGLFTRYAAIPLIITMLVAVFAVHFYEGFEKMELALHYLVGYILLLIAGPGKISIDGMKEKGNDEWRRY